MKTLLIIILGIGALVAVASFLRFLKRQDPLDIFTTIFITISLFGTYRLYVAMRNQNG